MEQSVALVAVENVAYHFDILYTYLIPENLIGKVTKGARVIVPFGIGKGNKRQGVVFSVVEATEDGKYKAYVNK